MSTEENNPTTKEQEENTGCNHNVFQVMKGILEASNDINMMDLARNLNHGVNCAQKDADGTYKITLTQKERDLLEIIVGEHYGFTCRDYKEKYAEIKLE
jgi:hypothetical protein